MGADKSTPSSKEFELNATSEQCQKINSCYGVWHLVLPSLPRKERLRLQQANQFFYNRAMGKL